MAQLVELPIYSRKVKTKEGKTFTSRKTSYDFLENGERVTHYVPVKFCGEGCFEGSPIQEKDITRGILTVDGSMINIPDKWNGEKGEDGKYIFPKDKDGKSLAPVCKIFGGIKGFVEIKKDHEYHFNTKLSDELPEEPEEVNEEDEK